MLLGEQLYLSAKGFLAGQLIGRAFAAHLNDRAAHPPWPWADFHPIARLEVPRMGVRRHVVTGGSGTSMAFGIGHLDGTAMPNAPGNCVLVGHRDTWLRFLRALETGDLLHVTTAGETRGYQVSAIEVVDHTDETIIDPARRGLTLVTCYPFDGWRGSPWRYAVLCRPLSRRGSAGSPVPIRCAPSLGTAGT
ncbi:MAG: class GN sortase [Candidatus Eisenbacteria sp.]|nr:class GN sortase [Candidatus Eisenbacteria bacterium]